MALDDQHPASPERDQVIREGRELLAELAQLNTGMVPLAMRMMEARRVAP